VPVDNLAEFDRISNKKILVDFVQMLLYLSMFVSLEKGGYQGVAAHQEYDVPIFHSIRVMWDVGIRRASGRVSDTWLGFRVFSESASASKGSDIDSTRDRENVKDTGIEPPTQA
jgi:hypothetical protein